MIRERPTPESIGTPHYCDKLVTETLQYLWKFCGHVIDHSRLDDRLKVSTAQQAISPRLAKRRKPSASKVKVYNEYHWWQYMM